MFDTLVASALSKVSNNCLHFRYRDMSFSMFAERLVFVLILCHLLSALD